MAIRIRRREFIVTLGGVTAWPHIARAQQPLMPVIGFLNGGTPEGYAPMVAAFRHGLTDEKCQPFSVRSRARLPRRSALPRCRVGTRASAGRDSGRT
jgi:hypothetical protein